MKSLVTYLKVTVLKMALVASTVHLECGLDSAKLLTMAKNSTISEVITAISKLCFRAILIVICRGSTKRACSDMRELIWER